MKVLRRKYLNRARFSMKVIQQGARFVVLRRLESVGRARVGADKREPVLRCGALCAILRGIRRIRPLPPLSFSALTVRLATRDPRDLDAN